MTRNLSYLLSHHVGYCDASSSDHGIYTLNSSDSSPSWSQHTFLISLVFLPVSSFSACPRRNRLSSRPSSTVLSLLLTLILVIANHAHWYLLTMSSFVLNFAYEAARFKHTCRASALKHRTVCCSYTSSQNIKQLVSAFRHDVHLLNIVSNSFILPLSQSSYAFDDCRSLLHFSLTWQSEKGIGSLLPASS